MLNLLLGQRNMISIVVDPNAQLIKQSIVDILFPSHHYGDVLPMKQKWPLNCYNKQDMRELQIWFFYWLQDGNEVFFRIKRSTQLKKLMNAYCDRQSVDFNSIAFLFDGRRLRAEQTPDEVSLSLCHTLSDHVRTLISQRKEQIGHENLMFVCSCALYLCDQLSCFLTIFLPCFSWRWRMAMKLMQCFIKLEGQLFELSLVLMDIDCLFLGCRL